MTTYVALLRGINVGGRNRLAMADLRRLLAELGHGVPRTYVQSGNAVFASDRSDVEEIAGELAARIAAELDVRPAVVLRTAEELRAVAEANPYADEAAADPTSVHVAFLSAVPVDPATFAFDADDYAPEELTVADRELYLHLPGGIGRSRLATDLARRHADVEMTMRNWRTVTKLLDLAGT
jgi:uncharacterized protein (DUF1697 family)